MPKKQTPLDIQISPDEYLEKKIYYLESQLNIELGFNKNLMNLSAGALVLSVTIVQLFKQNSIIYESLLFWAWSFLLISTMLCLSFYKITVANLSEEHDYLEYIYNTEPPERYEELQERIQKEKLREYITGKGFNEKLKDRINSFLNFLSDHFSKITTAFFLVGVSFLMLFTYFNI